MAVLGWVVAISKLSLKVASQGLRLIKLVDGHQACCWCLSAEPRAVFLLEARSGLVWGISQGYAGSPLVALLALRGLWHGDICRLRTWAGSLWVSIQCTGFSWLLM